MNERPQPVSTPKESNDTPELRCDHRPACPGCPLIELPYAAQLEAKRARLAKDLAAFAELRGRSAPPVREATPRAGYRHRLKWAVDDAGHIGLFDPDHRVIDLAGCPIAHPRANAVADTLRRLAKEPAHRDLARTLTGVDVRVLGGTHERVMVTLILSGGHPSALDFAQAITRAHPEVVTVAESARARRSPQLLGGPPRVLLGKETGDDRYADATIRARPGSFVQAHREQAARIAGSLVEEAAKLARELGRDVRVLELYSGSGSLGLPLARAGATVTMVDSFAPALEDVEKLADQERIRVRAVHADAEVFLPTASPGDFDVILVDPPRRGLGARTRKEIARLAPQALWYVSCAPETFSRDLAHLAHLGLAVRSMSAFDMMPQTGEVESVAVLRPEPAPPLVAIGARAIDKPPHVPAEGRAAYDLPEDASGAWVKKDAGKATELDVSGFALVKGVPRARGRLANAREGKPATYQRLQVASGHSLVRFTGIGIGELRKQMARFGHPVLGDPRHADERTNKHMFEAHGLDRLAIHVSSVRFGDDGSTVTSPLPGDLTLVMRSLGFGPDAAAS